MSRRPRPVTLGAVFCLAISISATGCSRGSQVRAAATRDSQGASGCPQVMTKARAAVEKASARDTPWNGPTSGPKAAPGQTVVYVAQSMQNPGVAGVAAGLQDATRAIGWTYKSIDGQGTPAGIQNAFNQALALKPDGIIIGGFDPNTTANQVRQANAAGIPLVGWQALAAPGPSSSPKLFSNVTTRVSEVAKISADFIIDRSNGRGGVVIFTDSSIPFAEGKSQQIQRELKTCSTLQVLKYDNIPLADVASRMPAEINALLSSEGSKWTYSVAINDVYFENATAAFRQAGRNPDTAPANIGAGDGDQAALTRIRRGEFQAATVPSPLRSEGWQIIDEMNRAISGTKPSGYVPQVHLSTRENLGPQNQWDPSGYQAAYRAIWGK